MPTFAFQARDKSGERVAGTREANDKRAALEALREMGLFVTQLVPASGSLSRMGTKAVETVASPPGAQHPPVIPPSQSHPAIGRIAGAPDASRVGVTSQGVPTPAVTANSASGGRASAPPLPTNLWLCANAKERSLWFRQMNSMLNAGTSLAHALTTLGEHASNAALRQASREMARLTTNGRPWHETMRAYPALFDQLSLGMIEAGERGGFLDRMCLRLAEYGERDYELQQTIKRESWYPKLLVFCSTLIPSSVPAVLSYMRGGNALGAWLAYMLPPALMFGTAWLGWKLWKRMAPVAFHGGPLKRGIDRVKLQTPFFNRTVKGFTAAKFCRALGALYASGMGIHRMIDVAAGACGNEEFAARARATIPAIERGVSLTDSMAASGYFPGIALQMMRTGEMSGNLDGQLDKVADFLEADAETSVKMAVKVLGIVMFLAVGIYIGMNLINEYTGLINGVIDEGNKMGEG